MEHQPGRGVLVVEDEEQLLSLLSFFLEREEFRVFRAKSGLEALGLFRTHQEDIQLMVTDLGLPELGGTDLITAVRGEKPAVKIIGVSGLSGQDVSELALGSGADLFLPKPFRIEEMVTAIRSVLGTP